MMNNRELYFDLGVASVTRTCKYGLFHAVSGKLLAHHVDRQVLMSRQPIWQSLGIPTRIKRTANTRIKDNLTNQRLSERTSDWAHWPYKTPV